MRYRIFLVPLLLALFLLFGPTTPRTEAAAGIITTVAGGGVGDGGPATSGVFYHPVTVAVDGSGNLYVADNDNCRIRERVAIGGTITTVAGNGTCGFAGDGGPATSASLNSPGGAVVDSSGNLYIADPGNCRVRKVVLSTGMISTVAGNATCAHLGDGGAATSASLVYPSGVALDSTGANLYIADLFDCRVRKVVISTGIITTVAGNSTGDCFGALGDGGLATSAGLSYPTAVAVDGAGNFYIATLVDCRIRKVTLVTGIITTVAGNTMGLCSYGGDGGLATSASLYGPSAVAVDSAGANLYIADSGNCRIRKVIINSIITTVAGSGAFGDGCGAYSGDSGAATSARLNGPSGVALDVVAGNFYIADTGNCRIRKVTSGTIMTVAGNGTCGYGGDGGAATSASLNGPSGVAVGNGFFYMTDTANCRVRKVDVRGVITTVAGNGTCGYGGDGGPATSASLNGPGGVALDSSGNLYIADTSNCMVRKVSAAGVITTVAGSLALGVPRCDYLGDGAAATSASLDAPDAVAVSAAGILYIADDGNCVVRKVILSSGIISTFAGSAVGGVGTCAFSGDGGAATSATLSFPSGVALDASGNLYIADYGNCRIRKVSIVDSNITTVAGNGTCGFSGDGGAATSAMLYDPSGVAVSGGNLYIADSTNCRVRKVILTPPGTITTVAGNGTCGYSGDGGPATAASLSNPSALGVDWGGNLYIADTGNDRVRKVSSSVLVGGVSVAPDVAALRAVQRTTQGPTRVLVTAIALTVLALFGAAGVVVGRKHLH